MRGYLNDGFEPLSPLNCAKRSEDAADTKNLQDGDCASAEVQLESTMEKIQLRHLSLKIMETRETPTTSISKRFAEGGQISFGSIIKNKEKYFFLHIYVSVFCF